MRCKRCGFGMFDGLVPRDVCRTCEAAANPFTREDFEHAARAAGLRVRTWSGHTGTMCAIDDDQHGRMWMPPHDNSEALRLAVACMLHVEQYPLSVSVSSSCHLIETVFEDDTADRARATRHAIFRAAIAIGKAMLPTTTDNPTA